MEVPQKKGDNILVSDDEEFRNVNASRVPTLKSVFKKGEFAVLLFVSFFCIFLFVLFCFVVCSRLFSLCVSVVLNCEGLLLTFL